MSGIFPPVLVVSYLQIQQTKNGWIVEILLNQFFAISKIDNFLSKQIITTRSIENRKVIMSQNARKTQRSIEEYNSRKLIL